MTRFDDGILVAYVDGELDNDTAAAVEGWLARDAAAAARARRLREQAGLLRAAFNGVLNEPVPQRLRHCVGAAPDNITPLPRRAGPAPAWNIALPVAATLAALTVGLGSGAFLYDWRSQSLEQQAASDRVAMLEQIERTVNDALENQLSGTPVSWSARTPGATFTVTPLRTYRDDAGRYCREYRQELVDGDAREVSYGLSCRTGEARWENQMLLLNGGRKHRM
ncbi:MAG: RT0821/Lpp0805 family surface protein [Gammaproteobacteria bacterium]|nr:RT0821/Lpp0805 family surface protein [Gammaproteobacteria bacterium]